MFLADLFDFFVSQHTTLAYIFVFLLFVCSLLFSTVWLFLLNFESCLASPVLGKGVRAIFATLESLRSLVRLSHLELVTVGQGLLPLFGVLTSSEASRTRNFTDLVVNFVDICILLELVDCPHEGDFSHDDHLLKEVID